jgi:hypothetical protein
MKTLPDEHRLARLAKRLALPERSPDEGFAHRVELAVQAQALAKQAARAQREQLAVELGGGAALALAAHQILTAGDGAAALLLPLTEGLGTLTLVAVAVTLLVALVGGEREALA